MSGIFNVQIIYKPGFVLDERGPIIYLSYQLLSRFSGFYDITSAGYLDEAISPCSKQGLPPSYVTIRDCELLPHSFHLFLCKQG